jgi:hypothetical protein
MVSIFYICIIIDPCAGIEPKNENHRMVMLVVLGVIAFGLLHLSGRGD